MWVTTLTMILISSSRSNSAGMDQNALPSHVVGIPQLQINSRSFALMHIPSKVVPVRRVRVDGFSILKKFRIQCYKYLCWQNKYINRLCCIMRKLY